MNEWVTEWGARQDQRNQRPIKNLISIKVADAKENLSSIVYSQLSIPLKYPTFVL